MRDLMYIVEEGPPAAKHLMPPELRDYFQYMQDLSIVDGVICRGERLIIPAELRPSCRMPPTKEQAA